MEKTIEENKTENMLRILKRQFNINCNNTNCISYIFSYFNLYKYTRRNYTSSNYSNYSY